MTTNVCALTAIVVDRIDRIVPVRSNDKAVLQITVGATGAAGPQGVQGIPGTTDWSYTPAGTGAVTTSVQAKLNELPSVIDFGADPTGAADSTAAFNLLTARLRTLFVNTPDYDYAGISLTIPPGVYSVSSWDLTNLLTQNVHVMAHGAVLVARTAGKHVIDVLGSRYIKFHGLMVYSASGVVAKSGIQLGPKGTETCGNFAFNDVTIAGYFASAPLMNLGAETVTHHNLRLIQRDTAAGAFALIADGLSTYLPTSDYATVTRTTGVALSFTANGFYGCQIRNEGGGSAAYLGKTQGWQFDLNTYWLSFNDSAVIVHGTNIYRSEKLTLRGSYESSQIGNPTPGNTGLKYAVTFSNDGTGTAIDGFAFESSNLHASVAAFRVIGGGAYRLSDVDIRAHSIQGASTVMFGSGSISVDGMLMTQASSKTNLGTLTSFNGTASLDAYASLLSAPASGAWTIWSRSDSKAYSGGAHQFPGLSAVDSSYTPAGAGAVATNVQAKLREWVTSTDKGAVGSGASIQAALNDGAGGMVWVPPGTYTLTTPLTIPADTTLVALGFVTLRPTVTGQVFAVTASNASVVGFTIDGNKAAVTDAYIAVVTGANFTLRGCDITNAKAAVYITGTRARILDSSFTSSAATAIDLNGASRCLVRDCEFTTNVGFGVWIHNLASRNRVIGCMTIDNGLELVGITYDSALNQVTGCHAESCGDNGISVTGFKNVITGNTVQYNDFAGIYLYGGSNTVTGNTIIGNNRIGSTHAGITLGGNYGGTGQRNTVTGNSFDDDQAVPTQYASVKLLGPVYAVWTTTTVYAASAYVSANGNTKIYMAVTGGTASVEPTHTSGTVTGADGIPWKYLNTFQNGREAYQNVVLCNSFNRVLNSHIVDATTNKDNTVVVDLAGGGTPESQYAAPVGSRYMRLDGGASTTLYVKESGTGTTGWVAK